MSDIKSIEYHRKIHDIKKTITTAELYEYIVKLHTVVTDLWKIMDIQDKEIKVINARLLKLSTASADILEKSYIYGKPID